SEDMTALWQLGVLLARDGDADRYRAACQGAMRKFGQSGSSSTRLMLARLLLLRPGSGVPAAELMELIRRCGDEQQSDATAKGLQALAAYRLDQHRAAVQILTQIPDGV